MYFCRSWFSNMVSFKYVLVNLNFLHDIFSIKFYAISFLWDLFTVSFTIFLLMRNITQWILDTEVTISWKYFIFHEMTLKLYFMKCFERKISQCILPLSIFFYCWTNSTINFYSVNFYSIIKVVIIKVLLKCIFHAIDLNQPPVHSTSWKSFVKMDETWNHQI